MSKAVFAAFAAIVVVASCALPPEGPVAQTVRNDPRQCFTSRNVNNYAQQDRRTVNLRVSVSDVYQLTLLQDCPDIAFARGVGFSSQSQFICSGIDLDLMVPDSIGPRRCAVSSIRRLSKEEAAALPPAARP